MESFQLLAGWHMMRKPILAGALGALAAVIVLAGMVAFEVWPFDGASSPQERPTVLDDGPVSPAPVDILDVNLSTEESVLSEVTRGRVNDDGDDGSEAPVAADNSPSTEATGTTDGSEDRPRSGPSEVSTVQESVEFEVRDADGNIKK